LYIRDIAKTFIMKTQNIFLAIFILVIVLQVNAADSQIKQVVVYRQGAKITHTAMVSVAQGNTEIVLDNLTQYIDPNSLQVSTRGNAILLSASVRTNFLGYKTQPKRTKILDDSLQLVNDRIDWLGNEQAIYSGEEKLITDNQKIVNEKEKITVTDLSLLADFYRNRLTAIRKKAYDNNIELRKLKEKKKQLEQQLQEINYQKGQRMGEVVLNFSAEQAAKVSITFSYLTKNAGWSPIYDIRCGGTGKALDLLYKANVSQTTGYDWSGIDLTISTGNPTANNERPVLNPWYIDFLQPVVAGYGQYNKSAPKAASTRNMMMVADETEAMPEEPAAAVPYQVVQTTNQMAVEYDIKIKQDIQADGKEHIVPITSYELPAVYTYHTVPKLDQHAFLLAKVADYNQFNLLPGTTNIFFEGMYVGQTYLNPEVTGDSLILSLGRDDRISVKRDILKDYTSSKVIGTNKKEVKGYETIVRNNKTVPVIIEVLDQVPISQNKDIVVEIEDMSDAQYTEDYGKLLWKLNLAPGESKKIRLVYSVKYPKDKQVGGI
jgi:uncharacterized protein (TIGR02231 family)